FSKIGCSKTHHIKQNRRGLSPFAQSAEQKGTVPFSASGFVRVPTPKALNSKAQRRRTSGARWVDAQKHRLYAEGVTHDRCSSTCNAFGDEKPAPKAGKSARARRL